MAGDTGPGRGMGGSGGAGMGGTGHGGVTTGKGGGGYDGMSGQSGLDPATLNEMLRSEGGTPTGDYNKDRAELEYAQKVGTDTYAKTKNMDATQRAAYLAAEEQKQKEGQDVKINPEKMTGGSGAPLTRGDLNRQVRGIAAARGQAGGPGDGRGVEKVTGGGGGPIGVIPGRDDRPEREASGGQLNMDKMLEINQKITPTNQ